MSSVSSGIIASPELSSFWDSVKQPSSNVHAIKITIQNGKLDKKESIQGSGSNDLNSIKSLLNEKEACYVLKKLSSSKWLFIAWVPEKLSSVKDRMVYASSQQSAKSFFSQQYIHDQLHLTNFDDIPKSYGPNSSAVDAYSEKEKEVHKLRDLEETTRSEAIEKMDTAIKTSSQIGGYHSVAIPLDQSAVAAIEDFKQNKYNWVNLVISEKQDAISAKPSRSVSVGILDSACDSKEPGFYFYSFRSKNVFIYCCPDKSLPKKRMVYSTAKGSIIKQVESLGLSVEGKLEISSADELDEKSIEASLNCGNSFSAYQRNVSHGAPTVSKIETAKSHPFYGQRANGDQKGNSSPTIASPQSPFAASSIAVAGGKKKIIIPPSVAWG